MSLSARRKVVIIGDGFVGSTTAYTLMFDSLAEEIVIIDINKKKAEGDVLDMLHGMPLVEKPKKIIAGDYKDIENAHIIIITAGVGQKDPSETRVHLLQRNLAVFDSIIDNMKPYLSDRAIVLVVSNPVDILSYYTYKKLGISSDRVIGSGTVLDTQRLRYLLSQETNVDPRNVHAYVVGEHGDSEVMALSISDIGSIPFEEFCGCRGGVCQPISVDKLHEISDTVRNAAYDIIGRKGATYYAVALAVKKIVDVILGDHNSVLTVSTLIDHEFDGRVNDIYFSLPCVVNASGISAILRPNYSEYEVNKIVKSGDKLKAIIKELNI